MDLCEDQGGQLAVPTSDENFHEIMDLAEGLVDPAIHEKCLHPTGALLIWAGPTDEWAEGQWVSPYTRQPTKAKFWDVGQPVGNGIGNATAGAGNVTGGGGGASDVGRRANCATTGLARRWQNTECGELNCALCHFPVAMNLSMRGLCAAETKLMDGYFDKFYFARGFINGQPHWRGLGKSHIFYLPEAQIWRLESYYDRSRYADYLAEDQDDPNGFYPTGRSKWTVAEGICQLKDAERPLSLSNCIWNNGSGYDFTCSTGRCIPIGKRCDLVDDCPDASDEADCNILNVGGDYSSSNFPILKGGVPLQVKVNVTILAFAEINTVALAITTDFVLLMQWKDPRLTFANLLEAVDLNRGEILSSSINSNHRRRI